VLRENPLFRIAERGEYASELGDILSQEPIQGQHAWVFRGNRVTSPTLLNRGHQEADQDGDDGNDDQQLDEREAGSSLVAKVHDPPLGTNKG